MNSAEKLVMMANQIAANLAAEDDPVAATADHIRLYWDPHMRGSIREHKAGLSTIALAAVDRLE